MKTYTPKKRPTDINQRAKMIVDIAIGDIEDASGKNEAAVALGKLGGKARAEKLSHKKKSVIAKKAAKKRWSK
jgi:hypothetical protein